MRGKVITRDDEETVMRITPAYAGKSLFDFGSDRFNWDHPRLCGEKSVIDYATSTIWGSPPPMRGKGQLHHTSP